MASGVSCNGRNKAGRDVRVYCICSGINGNNIKSHFAVREMCLIIDHDLLGSVAVDYMLSYVRVQMNKKSERRDTQGFTDTRVLHMCNGS